MQEIIVNILSLDMVKANEEKIILSLSKFQLMQSKKYKIYEDYLRSIGGYYLINSCTSKLPLKHNAYGKPLKKDEYFNIAHSGEYIVFAKSDIPIGIDIEKVRNFNTRLVDYVCNKQDAETIKTREDFFTAWTLKESLIKCVGTGLAKGDIKDVPIYPVETRVYKDNKFSSALVRVKDYVVAVCVMGEVQINLKLEKAMM